MAWLIVWRTRAPDSVWFVDGDGALGPWFTMGSTVEMDSVT